jgi:hypothetical protein
VVVLDRAVQQCQQRCRLAVTVTVSAEGLAARLDQLPTRKQMWRAARLGTLTRAAIVIAWIEIAHRVCL